MRTLVVGDVHGCADELADLLRLAAADEVVFVGDLFTKGPDPAAVYGLIRGHRSVLGNHDVRLLESGAEDRSGGSVRRALASVDRSWRDELSTWPLTLRLGAFTVVHAYLDDAGPQATQRADAITKRVRDDLPGRPAWWSVYSGEHRVIFGHDARRGLVRVERKGAPYVLGLDTGCVYGGFLTGYVLEEDRYLQVRARHIYRGV